MGIPAAGGPQHKHGQQRHDDKRQVAQQGGVDAWNYCLRLAGHDAERDPCKRLKDRRDNSRRHQRDSFRDARGRPPVRR